MTLSIAAIAGPASASPPRAGTPSGDFALSLAQVVGASVPGSDDDPPAAADKATTDDADSRQEDAAGGNALPASVAAVPDPSLLAAWMMPVPIAPRAVAQAAAPAPAQVSVTATGATDAAAAQTPPDVGVVSMPVQTALPPSSATLSAPVAASSASPPELAPAALPAGAVSAATTAPPPAPLSPGSGPSVPPATGPAPVSGPLPLVAVAAPVAMAGVTIDTTPPVAKGAPPAVADPAPTASVLGIDTRSAPVIALPPAQPAASPPPVIAGALSATPAIQAFGQAMRAGFAKEERAATTDTVPVATTIAHTAALPAVAATGDAQQAPLDLRRDQWPHAMIDRIEALRDAADATSTRIRIVPDSLGPVDVALRKDGDTLHVHFTADQAQTRAILTDAQPRLAAIAEQRGLRLGGSSVDAGTGQQQQQPRSQTSTPPSAPSSPSVIADTAGDDDTRIA